METRVEKERDEKAEKIAKALEEHLKENISATKDLLQELDQKERERVLDWSRTYHTLTLQKVSELIGEYGPKNFYEGLLKYYDNTKPPF